MAAQLEEVVVPADPLELEHLGPDLGQAHLDLAGRRFIAARRVGSHRPGAGSALRSSLPLGVSGKRVQPHEGRRHHVLGQGRRAGGARSASAPAARRIRRHGVIGHQPLVARRVLAGQHHRLAHRRMLRQPRLDLAQLDPEAADLHLEVVAAQELDVAVRQIAAKVAGPVQPRVRLLGERIGRRTAPPSAPAGSDSPARPPPRRCTAPPPPPSAPARRARPGCKSACSRSDGRSGSTADMSLDRQRMSRIAYVRRSLPSDRTG